MKLRLIMATYSPRDKLGHPFILRKSLAKVRNLIRSELFQHHLCEFRCSEKIVLITKLAYMITNNTNLLYIDRTLEVAVRNLVNEGND